MKSGFSGGWQGGLILFIRAQALYSHGFLTRHPVNSRIPQTEEALAYLYCVLASAPKKKKKKYILDYLRLVLEVWSPHVIEKPSGIHS